MRRYVLDTNLYIAATRSDEAADRLKAFCARSLPYLYLHSVVAQELLAGAIDPGLERATQAELIAPFEAVGRVLTPSHHAWKRAGEIMARLVRGKQLSPGGFRKSFLNDCVLAASLREHGFVLVTANIKDFELIRSIEAVDVVPPWPSR